MMNITPVVKQLLIINIIFFIGSQLVPASYDLFSLYYIENEKFKIWQLITHMFMHDNLPNFTHILFNMFALYSFGSALEQMWGGKKFLFFYISCGLGAALLHTFVNYLEIHYFIDEILDIKPVVGASGAIYGLLVAFAFIFPTAALGIMFIPIPIKAKYFVPGVLCIDLFLGFKGQSIFGAGSTGIAHFAHIGGALTGFIMMWYWKKNQFNSNRWN